MYKYILCSGLYDLYDESIIYHEKKFTAKEFAAMYNEVLKDFDEDERKWLDDYTIAEKLCKKFGFVQLEFTTGIYSPSGWFNKEISIDQINDDCDLINLPRDEENF